MKIEVFTDFACPFCYIGKKRLFQAIEQLGLNNKVIIEYKAYQLQPDASKEESKPMLQGTSKEAEVVESILAHAKDVGLTYQLDKVVVGNTENAHRLAKWAKTLGKEETFMEETMHRYFTQGLDVNNEDELIAVAEAVGLPAEEARKVLQNPEAFQQELAQDRYDIQQIPVTSVPFFVFENRYGIKGVEPLKIFKETLQQTSQYIDKQTSLQVNEHSSASCSINGCE
ncbi:MAG: DsbA family oxidoreductase [Lysinibacillus sp.]